MKLQTTVFALSLPAAFAAGWYFRPVESGEEKSGTAPAEVLKSFSANHRDSAEARPNTTVSTPAAQTGRTFPEKGAGQWLHSLGGLDTIQDTAARDAIAEVIAKLTAPELAELDRALADERKDANVPEAKKKFATLLLTQVWPAWVRMDPAATMASMEQAGKEHGVSLVNTVQSVFRRFAAQDAEAALAAVERMPEVWRKEAGHGIMIAVSLRDPFAALELIPRLGSSASTDPRVVVDAAVLRDPQRTAVLTGPISGDAKTDNVFLRAMEKWCETDHTAAALWLESYQGPGKVTGLTAVLSSQAKTDAAGAASRYLSLQNPEQSPYAQRLAQNISRGLHSQTGPASSIEWAAKLTGNIGLETRTDAVANWVKVDPAAASSWIGEQPPGAVREDAATTMIPMIKSTDPAGAWAWANSLTEPERRASMLLEVSKAWQKKDATAATAAMEALPAEMRDAVGKAKVGIK